MVVIGVVEVRGGDLLEMLPQVAVVAVGDVDEGFSAGVVGSRGGDDLWAGLEGGGRVVELHVHAAGVAVGHLAGEEAKRVQRVTSKKEKTKNGVKMRKKNIKKRRNSI